MAQTTTSKQSNTFIPEAVGHISGNQFSHNKILGKKNITIRSAKEVRANGGWGANTLGAWKCLPGESVVGKDQNGREQAIGSKRKDTVPLKDI